MVLPECLLSSLFQCNDKKDVILENAKLHERFFFMKKKPEYAKLLDPIRFSGSPVNPYSEILDEALFNLQFAGALTRRNPDLVAYSKTDQFNASYDKMSKDLTQDEKELLEKFSKEFLQKL